MQIITCNIVHSNVRIYHTRLQVFVRGFVAMKEQAKTIMGEEFFQQFEVSGPAMYAREGCARSLPHVTLGPWSAVLCGCAV